MSARVAVVLLLLAAGLGAATLAGAQQFGSEESFNGALCYSCHSAWSPVPMRKMFTLAPAAQELAVGNPAEYSVTVQEAWVARPPWPKLLHFEAFIDLEQAPSLGFVSQQAAILGIQKGGTIAPPQTPLNRAEAFVTIDVPPGTSDLVLTLATNSSDAALGPDLVLAVYPGRDTPGPVAFDVRDDGARGEPERFVIHGGRNITALSPESSTWTVQARLKPTTTDGDELQLDPRTVPFTVTMDAYRNLTGETRQFLVVDRVVEAGQSTLLPFRLQATAAPGPGEHLLVTVNATAYYPHDAGGGIDDWGNFSKTSRVDVSVGPGGSVLLGELAPDTVAGLPQATLPLDRVSEAVGYMAAFLIVSSVVSGGMFGKASRRGLNAVFGTAKRRVAFHNALSYFLTLAAIVHTVLFIIEANYVWTLGIIWGGIAILAMFGLGVTGAWQVSMVRLWGYGVWRWTHFGLAVAAIAFTLVHMALDGANFVFVQEAVGWQDPFPDPRQVR